MTNPNPFVPKGSLLEQQVNRRSRLKLAVFCVLAVSVTGLVAMLIQGCKRERPTEEVTPPPMDLTNTATMVDTNPVAPLNTNLVPVNPLAMSNSLAVQPVIPVNPVAPVDNVGAVAGSTYTIVKGDTPAGIAKAHHVSLKALLDANPGLDPKKLKIGAKINIPAGTNSASLAPVAATPDSANVYTVKQGDTLATIAKANGVTLKALEAANPSVVPTKLKIGQKLNLPAKTAVPPAPVETPAAPMTLPPAPAPAPAPGTAPLR